MEMVLTREDVLREEALVRAREVCGQGATAESVVACAEAFFKFLTK